MRVAPQPAEIRQLVTHILRTLGSSLPDLANLSETVLLDEGRYQLAPLEQNRLFRSRALPGFWIDVNWLLADPLPPTTRCLEDILSAKP